MAILTVDIGNTHTVFGLFRSGGASLSSFRMQTDRHACSDEIYAFLDRALGRRDLTINEVEQVVVATVVPELEYEWKKVFSQDGVRFLLADHTSPWSFDIALPSPAQLGSDRMANAEAALRFGAPVIVVDAGTATTFDVIGKRNDRFAYLGGIIAPGVGISIEALVGNTSRLNAVSLTKSARGEFAVVGTDTESAMRSGAIRGFALMVDGMIQEICTEQNFKDDCLVIATGGYSGLLKGISKRVMNFEPNLTLEGLYAITQK